MNRLNTDERARVIACLVEGNSQRATVRMTGIAKKTVARLAVEIGEACEQSAHVYFVSTMRAFHPANLATSKRWSMNKIKVAHYQILERSVMTFDP